MARPGMNRLAVLCVVLICRASAFGLGALPLAPAQGSSAACSRGGASRLSMTGGGGEAAKRALCVLASGFEEVSGWRSLRPRCTLCFCVSLTALLNVPVPM